MPLTPLAARYDQFILDLDGCVWVGGEPTPGVVEALEELRAARQARSPSRPTTPSSPARTWSRSSGRSASARRCGDVVTVGGAMQHLPRRQPHRPHRLRDRQPRRCCGTSRTPGLKVLNGTDLASRAEVVVIGGTTDLVYADLRNARPGGAARRRPARHGARPHLPPAGRPLAGHGRDRRGRGVRDRAHGRRSSASPSRSCSMTALDRLGDGRRSSSATASTPTSPQQPRPAWTPRSCSATAPTIDELDGFEPQPVAVAATLADAPHAACLSATTSPTSTPSSAHAPA